jgi:hypothetical protein
MPELVNDAPFPNFRYYSSDNRGQKFGVVIVKATYAIAPSGRLLVAEEQAPMMFTDKCHGEVNVTSLWHPSDLVPNKPRTDIILNAVARAPEGRPHSVWTCGVKVEDREGAVVVKKELRVTGPRVWQPKWKIPLTEKQKREWRRHRGAFKGWELSEAEPISELPLHYEYAYGGLLQRGVDDKGEPVMATDQRNPLGRGWIDREFTDHTVSQPAPQIELVSDPIADPYRSYTPQSLGPIPCAWLPRRPLGGTIDDDWKAKVWPNWPADYSFAYHNSAHPELICEGYLKGNERIHLVNLCAGSPELHLDLPGDRMAVHFVREDGSAERKDMNLDTVFLDIAAPARREARVFLSWRVNFAEKEFEKAVIKYIPNIQPADQVLRLIRKRRQLERTSA